MGKTMTDIIDKEICDILQSHAGNFFTNKQVTPDTYADQLAWASLDEFEAIIAIEDKYSIELPDGITADFNKVSDFIKQVKHHMPEQVCHG